MGSSRSLILPFVFCFLVSNTGGQPAAPHTPINRRKDQLSNISLSIYRNSVHYPAYNTYDQVKNAIWCGSVPDEAVKYLLKNIQLLHFYGPSLSDWIAAPLEDALRLVEKHRWNKGKKPMAVYTHGWLDSPTSNYSTQLQEAYIKKGSFNLVMVDWYRAGAYVMYRFAATLVRPIGEAVAGALQSMMDAGFVLDHVVGNGMGAHISGHIGRNLKSRPRLVVGLDPAGPLFYPTMNKCGEEILSTDGEYVVALHTDEDKLGSNEPTGPADFYVFGESGMQPGCGVMDGNELGYACNQKWAIVLWSEAIVNSDSILGQLCSSYDRYQENSCHNMPVSKLADPNTNLEGLFFFSTNIHPPFGKGIDGVSAQNDEE